MIKKNRKLTLILVFLLCSISLSAYIVSAGGGNAGVGVMNVPPNYASIDIYPQDNTIRAYLTISDYNSWMDIHKVQVNLEENGVVLYSFISGVIMYTIFREVIPEKEKGNSLYFLIGFFGFTILIVILNLYSSLI